MLKNLSIRRPSKSEREEKVLLGLVRLYIEEGKPIGSNTLKEHGFSDLSSATIRNYLSKMEKEGYVEQQHASGGREPTAKAYRLYAEHALRSLKAKRADFSLEQASKKEIAELLQEAAEKLSDFTNTPIFLSAPIFEMDFIQTVRFIRLDEKRLLAVLITDFGHIRTELLFFNQEEEEDLELFEEYFYWRLSKADKPVIHDVKLVKGLQRLYNEVMVRHFVESSNTASQSLYKTGLSKLLSYPEFNDASLLAHALSLFESADEMHKLLLYGTKADEISYFIDDNLATKNLSIIMVPYYINQVKAGTIALLGPMRMNYPKLFSYLKEFSEQISKLLTHNVYKFKISFKPTNDVKGSGHINQHSSILLEDKRS